MATTVGDVAVRVGADVTPLQRDMKRGSKSLSDFGGTAKSAAGLVAKVGVAVAAAGVAVAAFSKLVADNAKELKAQATAANTSIGEFQSLAFAARSVGIEQEKLADILKDVNDRIGDFNQTGGGPMADFFEKIAPKVGVTADEFARLSGRDALQLYITSLEKANLSQADMTFYMEAIASDSSRLIGLFSENGAQLNALTSRYDKLNASLALSSQQAEDLSALSTTFELLGTTAKNAAAQVIANLAPAMDSFVADATESVPILTNHLIDFFNSFKDARDIVQVEQLERQIEDVNEKIAETEKLQASSAESFDRLDQAMRANAQFQLGVTQSSKDRSDQASESQQEYNEQLLAYRARLEELQQALADLKEEEVNLGTENIDLKTADEILAEQETAQARSLLAQQDYYNQRNAAAQEQADAEFQMKEEHDAIIRKMEKRLAKDLAQTQADQKAAMFNEAQKGFGRLSALMESEHKAMFEIGKAAAISQTVIDTYAAAQASYRALAGIPVVGPGLGAAAAAAAVAGGLARVSAISSRSFSSGGGASDPGAGAGNQASNQSQQAQSGAGQQVQTQQQVNLSLQGDNFSRNTVLGLIDQLNEAVADGAKIRVT